MIKLLKENKFKKHIIQNLGKDVKQLKVYTFWWKGKNNF